MPEISPVAFEDVSFAFPGSASPVFAGFSGSLPGGLVSLVGPNGSGKSTLLLLAAGRLLPQAGAVRLLGRDTRLFVDEDERNRFASFIYQNMEFESSDRLADALEQVYAGGAHPAKGRGFFEETVEAFELGAVGGRPLDKLAKGELQRALLAFAALYGSRTVFMDEPLFALEAAQKERALDFFRSYRKRAGCAVYLSLHELDLTRKYAERVLLFKPNREIDLGEPAEILTDAALEAAYGVPAALLKQKESLDREHLVEVNRYFVAGAAGAGQNAGADAAGEAEAGRG
jgi:iron complex transport system ATP-binding protein